MPLPAVLPWGPFHWFRINLVLQFCSSYLEDFGLSLGCDLYSSKNLCWLIPRVTCLVQNIDVPMVWRPFCRLCVCARMCLLREIKPLSSLAREHCTGSAALANSFSYVPSCAQQLNQLFLHSSCSGQNNLETRHLVQLSTLLLYDPPAEKGGRDDEKITKNKLLVFLNKCHRIWEFHINA